MDDNQQPLTSRLSIDRLTVFANFTTQLANLSKCTDKQVAAIIIDKTGTQVYSIGINGGPKGGIDCLCTLGRKYTCIHAEQNAIAKCTSLDTEKIMVCTLSPCITCAALIVNSGFSEVYYKMQYKDDTGLQILRSSNIKVFCLEDILGGE